MVPTTKYFVLDRDVEIIQSTSWPPSFIVIMPRVVSDRSDCTCGLMRASRRHNLDGAVDAVDPSRCLHTLRRTHASPAVVTRYEVKHHTPFLLPGWTGTALFFWRTCRKKADRPVLVHVYILSVAGMTERRKVSMIDITSGMGRTREDAS